MKFLKSLFHFYVNTSIHVGFSIVALTQISGWASSTVIPFVVLGFVFCSSVVAYNFIRYFPIIRKQRLKTSPFIYGMFSMSLCLFGVGIFYFTYLPFSIQLLSLIAVCLVLIYCLPLNKTTENFRNTGGLKIYMVALTWVIITVGFPLSLKDPFNWSLFFWLAFLQFIFVLVAIQPFDIRDMHLDQASLKTWPQRMGVKNTQWLGSALLFLTVFGLFLFSPFDFLFKQGTLLTFVLLAILLWKSKPQQSVYFSSFWVEGLPILWCILYQEIFL